MSLFAEQWKAMQAANAAEAVWARMHQRRHKRLTQGLLDIQRLYWNTHAFRAGKRKGSSPYRALALAHV